MDLAPITLDAALEYVRKYHRHCYRPKSWKFGISLRGPRGGLLGVVIVGRPIARHLDDGYTAEITRLCTRGRRNACSKLYAAARRAAFAMGYRRIITYTLATEIGSSLKASSFERVAETRAENWDRPGRRRKRGAAIPKVRWESRARA